MINLFLVQCWRDHKYIERAEEVNSTANHSALTSTEEEVPRADQHAGQDPHLLLLETTQLLHNYQWRQHVRRHQKRSYSVQQQPACEVRFVQGQGSGCFTWFTWFQKPTCQVLLSGCGLPGRLGGYDWSFQILCNCSPLLTSKSHIRMNDGGGQNVQNRTMTNELWSIKDWICNFLVFPHILQGVSKKMSHSDS